MEVGENREDAKPEPEGPGVSSLPVASVSPIPTEAKKPAVVSAVPAASTILKGKAWVFGNDINTDIIIPFRFKARTNTPEEMAQYCMYGVDPDFSKKVAKGDIIVAGKNFGGGSSREQAPVSIKYAGISCVVAESFSRIFTRNCFAIGLPILEIADVTKAVKQGDDLEVDIDALKMRNATQNTELSGHAWPDFLVSILKAGGLVEYYKKNKKFPWE